MNWPEKHMACALTATAHLRRETTIVLETLLVASNRTPPCNEVPNPEHLTRRQVQPLVRGHAELAKTHTL